MDRGSLLTHSWVPANSGAQLPISPPLVPSQGGAGVAVGCGVPAGSGVAVGPGVAEGSGVDVAVGVAVGAGATVDAAAVGSGAAVAVAGSGVGVGAVVVAGSGAIVGAWGACVGGTCVAVGGGGEVGVAGSSPPQAASAIRGNRQITADRMSSLQPERRAFRCICSGAPYLLRILRPCRRSGCIQRILGQVEHPVSGGKGYRAPGMGTESSSRSTTSLGCIRRMRAAGESMMRCPITP